MFFCVPDGNNAHISLSHHRSLGTIICVSVALLLLCRGTWLIELLVTKSVLRPSLFLLSATAGVRYGMICVTEAP